MRDGDWQEKAVDTCENGTCWCGTVDVDRRGRLHVVYGRTEEGVDRGEVQLVHGMWDGSSWELDELGVFDRGSIDMKVDGRGGIVHILARINSEQHRRTMVCFQRAMDGE